MSINSCSCKAKFINLVIILIISIEINAEINFFIWLISKYSTRFFEDIYKVEVVNWSLLQPIIWTSNVIQLKVGSPSGSLLANLDHMHPRSQEYSGKGWNADLENTTWVLSYYTLITVFLISYLLMKEPNNWKFCNYILYCILNYMLHSYKCNKIDMH